MPHKDDLGSRMKRYEIVSSPHLTPRTPVIVRVDGRAFHTWTRGAAKPFDRRLMDSMTVAMMTVADDIQGCVFAYTQSDEASFLLNDFATIETQSWFGYDLSKVVSIAASTFTANFNSVHPASRNGPATFDARAFNIPESDVANYFLWRAKDWWRNSIQMMAQTYFSPKELNGKSCTDLVTMLLVEKGIDWAAQEDRIKYGTFYARPNAQVYHVEPVYSDIDAILGLAMAAT